MSDEEARDGAQLSDIARRYDRIADLHEVASMLLDGLDDLGLHEAAAYVSLARRRIRDQHPVLATAVTHDSQLSEPGRGRRP